MTHFILVLLLVMPGSIPNVEMKMPVKDLYDCDRAATALRHDAMVYLVEPPVASNVQCLPLKQPEGMEAPHEGEGRVD